jgi:hypothetical protein
LAGRDLSRLPEDQILAMMARYLRARVSYPVGSVLWAQAVKGYEECKAELDQRLIEIIVAAVRERDGELG